MPMWLTPFASPVSSICFNNSHFLETSAGVLRPAHQPTADVDAHPHPTQAATVQPPQQKISSERFDLNTAVEDCPALLTLH